MRERAEKLMTVDEFMAWEDGTDARYELDEGVAVPMSPPAGPHGTIVANATGICWSRLRDRPPCRPENELASASRQTRWRPMPFRLPASRDAEDPSLISEVLSPTTRMHNLKAKRTQSLAAVRKSG